MKEFSIFLTGLASGLVIGLLMRRPSPRRINKPARDMSCCAPPGSSLPRVAVKPRALPSRSTDAPTERFPRSLENYLPPELKSHTPE